MSQDRTYVGIDLGTYKTSIVCSNGNRAILPTAVAWPKDHVAQRRLGMDVVFGDTINQHPRSLNVTRPFQRGALKYVDPSDAGIDDEQVDRHQHAAHLIVEHALSLVSPPTGTKIFGSVGTPSRASDPAKRLVLDSVSECLDAAIVVAEPFAVAYGMNKLDETLVVDIGAGTIDICPMYGAYPTEDDQVTIPLGGDLIDEHVLKLIRHAHPDVRVSLNTIREIKEKHGCLFDAPGKAIVTLNVDGTSRQFDLAKILTAACSTFVEPIVEGIHDVVRKFEPDEQQTFMKNILLAGGGSQLAGLDKMLEEAIERIGGGTVSRVYDSAFAGATGALKLAMDMPEDQWQSVSNASLHAA